MIVKIEIHCDNDSFGETRASKLREASRMLADLAKKGLGTAKLLDANGNTVGFMSVTP